jgi:hypothetical protein
MSGAFCARYDFRVLFSYGGSMFDPDAGVPRQDRALVYLGALITVLRLAWDK